MTQNKLNLFLLGLLIVLPALTNAKRDIFRNKKEASDVFANLEEQLASSNQRSGSICTGEQNCIQRSTLQQQDLTSPKKWKEFREDLETVAKSLDIPEESIEVLEKCVRKCNRADRWTRKENKHERLVEEWQDGNRKVAPFACMDCVGAIPSLPSQNTRTLQLLDEFIPANILAIIQKVLDMVPQVVEFVNFLQNVV